MAGKRETACMPPTLPADWGALLQNYRWSRNLVGESGGAVYRLHDGQGAPDVYVKHGRDAVADAIAEETNRLLWLAQHVPAPAVIRFTATDDEAWLLMTALPGETAYQALTSGTASGIAIVDALADFLQRLHAIPSHDCPFNSDHVYRLAQARHRIEAGLVDEDDFDVAREGWTAGMVWDDLQRHLPLAVDPVVTHGDFSLDNILMSDSVVTGCIDAGRVGVADRYQDLAILWNCLGEFGAALQDRLLTAYGLIEVDQSKLDFHLLLDELF
ncbi:APH(3')-I family aminoglycoside O-phosphotransferase [Novosphingobium sp.]|uniref:APH(3')-I family aminoglycoside O-phosphotransferase n=1 Tax=Novosphingobium sp. TaxID=1874826 RepID=UPI002FDDC713